MIINAKHAKRNKTRSVAPSSPPPAPSVIRQASLPESVTPLGQRRAAQSVGLANQTAANAAGQAVAGGAFGSSRGALAGGGLMRALGADAGARAAADVEQADLDQQLGLNTFNAAQAQSGATTDVDNTFRQWLLGLQNRQFDLQERALDSQLSQDAIRQQFMKMLLGEAEDYTRAGYGAFVMPPSARGEAANNADFLKSIFGML